MCLGEGFINQGYIVVEENSILDMKGLFFLYPVFSNGFGAILGGLNPPLSKLGEEFIDWGYILVGQVNLTRHYW